MNTGIGDAVNLAWKLSEVLHQRADAKLLDTYEPERMAFARRLVATTDRAFTAVTSSGPVARLLRLQVAPRLVPLFFGFGTFRRFLFRTVSQIVVNYRESSLSHGRTGSLHAGDRLPWADNFQPLAAKAWQVHVYGNASPELRSVCAQRNLPLHIFPWSEQTTQTALKRNALYLVRPDGYIALADHTASPSALTSYLEANEI